MKLHGVSLRSSAAACVILLMSCLTWGYASAQIERTLKFIPEKVDFGAIRETDGKATRSVKAVNISQDSTFIISARTSCGCSEAEYDARMLAPGDTATVRIAYDPTDRPGKFSKTAKFFTGKERIGNSLRISGTVIPSPANLDRQYPEKIKLPGDRGELRLSALLINAGEIKMSAAKPFFLGLYNDSDKPLAITAAADNDALEVRMLPDSIEPYGVATLTVMLKGRKIPDGTDTFTHNVTITCAGDDAPAATIPVAGAVIKETGSKR